MRRWIPIARRVHCVIALAVGLHFVLIATTGAIFIFEPELKQWSRHLRGWTPTAGDVGPEVVSSTIREAFPDWDGTFLNFPRPEAPFYTAYLGTDSDVFWTDVFVDPGTGRVVGTINNAGLSIEGGLQIAIQLHIRLCSGEVGRRLVGVSVLLFVVEMATGLLLWWAGLRRMGMAFVVRLRRSRFLALYDLHRLAGMASAPWLIVMSLTGLLWAYPTVMVPLVYWCCGERAPAESDAYREPEGKPETPLLRPDEQAIPLLEITRRVTADIPRSGVAYLMMDHPRSQTLTLGIRRPLIDGEEEGDERVEVDRRTGKVIEHAGGAHEQPSLATRLTDELAHELHYGTFGGLATRIVYLVACLAVDLLYVSGIAMWLIKRGKRRRGVAERVGRDRSVAASDGA